MKIYTSSDYHKRFVDPLCKNSQDLTAGTSEIARFPNGEMHVYVNDSVNNEHCVIIGSVAPPDEQLLALLMLANTLKRNGAANVRAFLPYLGYARQDKFAPGESGGIAFIGGLLQSAGVDEIVTIDVHSDLDKQLLGLPLKSLPSTPLFIPSIQGYEWDDVTIVAPDEGAINRARLFAAALGIKRPVAHLVKKRLEGIVHLGLVGELSDHAVIVDDIVDSGHTLVSACNVLREHGVQEIVAVVTHGLFTNGAWKRVFGLGAKTLFVSDSCPEALAQKHPGVQMVPITPLLSAILPEVIREEKQYENAIA